MSPDSGGETRVHSPQGDMALVLYRLTELEKKVDLLLNDHETRLRQVEDKQGRMEERQNNWNIGLGTLAVILSTLAAILGKHIP